MTARFQFGRRVYLLLALGTIAFTLYGSYVPFQFRNRPWNEVTSTFLWAMQNRTGFESRSDGIANWMLGVPLGFCLLGALRADRSNGFITALIGGLLVPVCTLFAALVEFGQLYFPARTCAGSDVIAQGLGSLCGVLLWVLFGPWLTRYLRNWFGGEYEQSREVRFCAAYAGFVILVQWLPLDFTVSPYDIYRWMKRDYLKVSYFPFEELRSPAWRDGATIWEKVQSWLELAILFLPMGVLLSRIGRWQRPFRIVALAFVFAFMTEVGQITVSRHPSSADVIVETVAIVFGWLLAKLLATLFVHRHRLEAAYFLGQLWLIAMVLIHWHPFRFSPNRFRDRLEDLEWWPLAAEASENYLRSMDKIFTKFVLFVPMGMLVCWAGQWANTRKLCRKAALISAAVTVVRELGQMMLPGRLGNPTDVVFGIIGGWLGAALSCEAFRAPNEKAS